MVDYLRNLIIGRDNSRLILLLMICLSLMTALMHYIFIINTKENMYFAFNYQQKLFFSPNQEARLLSSLMVNGFYFATRQAFLALILTEFVFAVFSFWAMYKVAQIIIKDERFSLLAVFSMALFAPISYQLAAYRFGELLLFGFYLMAVLLVLKRKEFLFVLLLFIASLQRPEVAVAAVMFKMVFEFYAQKKYLKLAYNFCLISIPFLVVMAINHFYDINTASFYQGFTSLSRLLANLKGAPLYLSVYAPLALLVIFNFNKFGLLINLMLLSLVPYFLVLCPSGNFSEPRIFFVFVSVLIIGVANAIKSKGSFTVEKLIS